MMVQLQEMLLPVCLAEFFLRPQEFGAHVIQAEIELN